MNILSKIILMITTMQFSTAIIFPQQNSQTENKYVFTEDHFSSHIETWKDIFKKTGLKDQPNLHYLEVGVFEGRSFFWMLDNVLTNKASSATAIDVFLDNYWDTFQHNVEDSGAKSRIQIHKGPSREVLRTLPFKSYDIIYIDASHLSRDVISDAVLCWELLKTDGILIFDDYLWFQEALPKDLRPKEAINFFLLAYGGSLEILNKGYQIIVRKKECPCCNETCIPIGDDFLFNWYTKKLYDRKNSKYINLNNGQIEYIDKLLGKLPATHRPIDASEQKVYDSIIQEILLKIKSNR